MPRTALAIALATALALALAPAALLAAGAPAQAPKTTNAASATDAANAVALAAPPAGETACTFGAFVRETDPAGLNVRAGPGTAHKVLGTLPPIRRDDAPDSIAAMVEVEVIAGRDGWFKIRGARDNELLSDLPPRPMFQGAGWVSGRKLTVKSQATLGRARPDAKAPAVLIGRDGVVFDSDAFLASGQLAGCAGRWALVEYGPIAGDSDAGLEVRPAARAGLAPGRFRTWVDRLCGLQETSCDGT